MSTGGGDLIATIDPNDGTMDSYEVRGRGGGAGDGSDRLEFEGTGTGGQHRRLRRQLSASWQVADPTGLAGNDTIRRRHRRRRDLLVRMARTTCPAVTAMTPSTGGAGDEIVGGSGSDSIVIRRGRTGRDRRERWPDLRRWLDRRQRPGHAGPDRVRGLPQPRGNAGPRWPTAPRARWRVQNADGDWVPVTFAEIETLLLPPKAPDGVVDGEENRRGDAPRL